MALRIWDKMLGFKIHQNLLKNVYFEKFPTPKDVLGYSFKLVAPKVENKPQTLKKTVSGYLEKIIFGTPCFFGTFLPKF